MSWKYKSLGELYAVHNGLSKGSKFFGKGFPFLSFSAVFNNWFLPRELHDLVQSTEEEQQSYSIRRGDIFITRTSETMDELGMSSVALKDYPYATYNGFTKRLRPINSEQILPEFIGYYLRTPIFRAGFTAFSTMTTRASLRNEDLLSMKVPVPDMLIQHRIASVLSAYDDLIENNRRQIKLLEEAAQRLYKEWFVDLHFPGHETTPIVEGIPEGWKQLPLGQVAPILTGKKDANFSTVDGQYPFFTCAQTPLQAPSYSFDCDAVILAGNGDFNVKLYRGQFEAYQRTYVLSPENKELLFLLYHAVNNSMAKLAQGASGSTIKFLTKGMIASILVCVPDESTLNKYNNLSEATQRQIEVLKRSIVYATEARDRLLPKLMSGEIEL